MAAPWRVPRHLVTLLLFFGFQACPDWLAAFSGERALRASHPRPGFCGWIQFDSPIAGAPRFRVQRRRASRRAPAQVAQAGSPPPPSRQGITFHPPPMWRALALLVALMGEMGSHPPLPAGTQRYLRGDAKSARRLHSTHRRRRLSSCAQTLHSFHNAGTLWPMLLQATRRRRSTPMSHSGTSSPPCTSTG